MKLQYKIISLMYLLWVIPLFASAKTNLTQNWKEVEKSKTTIGYEKFIRLNSPQNKSNNSDWLDISRQYLYKKNSIEGKFSGDFRFYLNNKETALSLADAYLRYKGKNQSVYTLGKQRLDWHPNESFWQLDHFQNTRGFRLMDLNNEGLTGFHYKTRDGRIKTEVFLSYFYIPGLNPSVKVEDGTVNSNTDWYKKPPKKTIISNQEVDIFYGLESPDIRDIIVQKSLGLRMSLDWGKENMKGSISAFSIYKPERRLRTNAEAYYDPTIDKVVATANPVVNHHMIHGLDLRQNYKNLQSVLGITTVDPNSKLGADFDSISLELSNNRTLQSEYFKVEPVYSRETYAHFSTTLNYKRSNILFNYIHYITEHENEGDDFYSETTKWARAAGLGSSVELNDWVYTLLNFRYDLKRKDNLLNVQLTLSPLRNININIGAELIKSPKTNSYWSAYRTNDTFYVNFRKWF